MIGFEPLEQILRRVLGETNVSEAVRRYVRRRIDEQRGRSAGMNLGYALHKGISQAMGAGTYPLLPGAVAITAAQRAAIGRAVAANAATQLVEASVFVEQFAAAQGAYELARGSEAAPAALVAREAAEELLEQALIDVGRVLAGDLPRVAPATTPAPVPTPAAPVTPGG